LTEEKLPNHFIPHWDKTSKINHTAGKLHSIQKKNIEKIKKKFAPKYVRN